MAAFSYQHNHFLLLSPSFSNSTTSLKMCDTPTNFLSQFNPPEPNSLGYGVDVILPGNDTSSLRKQISGSSIIVDKVKCGEQVTPNINSKEEKRKKRNVSFFCSVQFKNKPERRGMKQKKRIEEKKNEKKVPEEAQTDFIHVRARRGQATDSHSLAERVRREKISERMKILQRLVPGCEKVIGKALVLDEIINYVQSLQNQVEFLSMKLTSVNQLSYQFETHLDSFMLTPESMISSMASCNLQQSSGFSSHISTFSHLLMDHSPSLPVDQVTSLCHFPASYFQDNVNLMWEGEDPEQKFLISSALSHSL